MAEQVNNNQVPTPAESVDKKEKRQNRTNNPMESTQPIKIGDLKPRNNNSNFIGKVVEVQVQDKGTNKQGNPRKFLKGIVGDETGTVRFDMAVKGDLIFKVGDVVTFDKAMNKVNKDGHHYIEIKRFGKYEIASNLTIASVNEENNLSTKVIPPLPEDQKKQKKNFSNNNTNNKNHNNNNNQQTKKQSNGQTSKPNKGPRNNFNQQNQQNSQNQQNQNDTNKPRQYRNKNSKFPKSNFRRPYQQRSDFECSIKDLKPGQNGQTIKGKILELTSYQKPINGKDATFFKGRVADETANINFDFMMKHNKPISLNDFVVFNNIMNKISETHRHYIVVGKFGGYTVWNEKQIKINEQENKSSIEYTPSNPSNNSTKQ